VRDDDFRSHQQRDSMPPQHVVQVDFPSARRLGAVLEEQSRACTVVSDAKCTSGQMAFRNELRVDGARLNDHNFGVHISARTIQSLNASD
jgi:hypothetical protein